LEVREVSLRRRRLTQIPVFGLRDHSDHLNIRLGSRSLIIDQPKAPADRIAGRKIAFGKALFDDRVLVLDFLSRVLA